MPIVYRSGKYPTYSKRIATIAGVARSEGVALPNHSQLNFGHDQRGIADRHRFMVRMADECTDKVIPSIWAKVQTIISDAALARPIQANAIRRLKELQIGIPLDAAISFSAVRHSR